MSLSTDQIIRAYAVRAEHVYRKRIAGDHTWAGLLAAFLRDCEDARAVRNERPGTNGSDEDGQ